MKPSQFFFVKCDSNAYNTLSTITQKAIENAGVVAETYNGLNGVLTAIKDKANAIASKIAAGGKATASEIATLQQATKLGIAQMQASLDAMRAGLGDKINAETAKLLQTKINELTTTAQDIATPATALVAAQALAKIDPVEMVKEVKKLQPLAVEYNGKSFSSKGAIIKMQPGNIDGVMQSNGDISLMCGFDLKNTVEGDPITWHLETSNGTVLPLEAPLRTSASSKDTFLGIKWPDGQNSLKLSVVSGERSLHFTLLKPDWKVSGLQIADGGRVAKAGETLYLVKSPLKNEKATVSWTSNLDPLLLNNHYFVNGTKSLNNLSAHKIPYNFSSSPSKTTYRLNALGYDESVKVEVVDYYKTKSDASSDQITFKAQELCETISNGSEKINSFIEKYTSSKAKIEVKPKITGSKSWYNEEDKKSRLYYDVKIIEVGGEISTKLKYESSLLKLASIVPIPEVVDNQLSKLLKAKFTFTPSVNFGIGYSQKERKWAEKNSFENWQEEGFVALKFAVETGFELELLPGYTYNPLEIKADVKAKTGVDFKGKLELQDSNWYVKGSIILKPLVALGSLKIKTKKDANLYYWIPEFTLIDTKVEYTIFEEIKLYGK